MSYMKYIFLFFFLMSAIRASLATDVQNLGIQGTFNGGCGYSIMIKNKLLNSMKLYLEKTIKNITFVISMVNYAKQIEPAYEDLDSQLIYDKNEFNVYLILPGNGGRSKRKLIGTSDVSNKEYFYEYLMTGEGLLEEEFLKMIHTRIVEFLNKYSSHQIN